MRAALLQPEGMMKTKFLKRMAAALPVVFFWSLACAQTVATPDNAAAKSGVLAGLGELSPWSMFLGADWVVKAVMIGLMFASLVTWTIFVGKFIELLVVRRRLMESLRIAAAARSLDQAIDVLRGDRSVARAFFA